MLLLPYNLEVVALSCFAAGGTFGYTYFCMKKFGDYDTPTSNLLLSTAIKNNEVDINNFKPYHAKPLKIIIFSMCTIILAIAVNIVCFIFHAISVLEQTSSISITLGNFLPPFVIFTFIAGICYLSTLIGCRHYDKKIEKELEVFESKNAEFIDNLNLA